VRNPRRSIEREAAERRPACSGFEETSQIGQRQKEKKHATERRPAVRAHSERAPIDFAVRALRTRADATGSISTGSSPSVLPLLLLLISMPMRRRRLPSPKSNTSETQSGVDRFACECMNSGVSAEQLTSETTLKRGSVRHPRCLPSARPLTA